MYLENTEYDKNVCQSKNWINLWKSLFLRKKVEDTKQVTFGSKWISVNNLALAKNFLKSEETRVFLFCLRNVAFVPFNSENLWITESADYILSEKTYLKWIQTQKKSR